jgi:hypothetical protein
LRKIGYSMELRSCGVMFDMSYLGTNDITTNA